MTAALACCALVALATPPATKPSGVALKAGNIYKKGEEPVRGICSPVYGIHRLGQVHGRFAPVDVPAPQRFPGDL